MSENKEFALQLALEKIEAAEMRIAQLSHEADFARSDAKHWMKKAKHFEGFVRYKCDECGLDFAVKDIPDNEMEEPACNECGSTNCSMIEAPR